MNIMSIVGSLKAWGEILCIVVLIVMLGTVLAALGKARLTSSIYATRLAEAHDALGEMKARYNDAIARTAVTELHVTEDRISVMVRRHDGRTVEVPTECDPRREVYIDYVVMDGRLWIRRLFDDATSPNNATLVDASLGTINWSAEEAAVGKAIYRKLDAGRWVVTVTGNGALGLAKAREDAIVQLPPPPVVRDFAVVMDEVDSARKNITLSDMVGAAFSLSE